MIEIFAKKSNPTKRKLKSTLSTIATLLNVQIFLRINLTVEKF